MWPALGGGSGKFVLVTAKGDEDVRCKDWGLPQSNSDELFSACLANRCHRLFTDLGPTAAWRHTEIMPVQTWAARLRKPLHPLAASQYCCFRWLVYLDMMNVMDCKGVATQLLGSLLSMEGLVWGG